MITHDGRTATENSIHGSLIRNGGKTERRILTSSHIELMLQIRNTRTLTPTSRTWNDKSRTHTRQVIVRLFRRGLQVFSGTSEVQPVVCKVEKSNYVERNGQIKFDSNLRKQIVKPPPLSPKRVASKRSVDKISFTFIDRVVKGLYNDVGHKSHLKRCTITKSTTHRSNNVQTDNRGTADLYEAETVVKRKSWYRRNPYLVSSRLCTNASGKSNTSDVSQR